MRAHRFVSVLAVFLLLGLASQARAQLANSSISGTVTGADGAGLPAVTVTVRNQESGLVRTTVTATNGSYAISGVKPGVYEVSFDLEGFPSVNRRDVELRVGQETRLGATMKLEQIEESITVIGEAPVVETTSKEIGGTLTTQEFQDLPTQNRSFALFAALLPGVVPVPSTESTSGDAIFVNGQDDNNNSFNVDGANNDDDVIGARAGAQTRTAIEAIQEFQVLTSQFDAEFGRSTGAVLNAVTKSGGNSFHGSAFSYFQRSDWNETDFFIERSGQQQPETKFDSLGGTLGGPIIRDKVHFFASYEDDTAEAGTAGVFTTRPELNFATTTDNKIKNHLAKVDYQITANNLFAARYLLETSPQFNQIINAGNSRATLAASREEDDTDSNWIATLDSVFGSDALNNIRLSFTKEDVAFANPAFNNNGQSFAAQRDQAPVEVRPTILDGGSGVAQARVNKSTQLDDTVSYFLPAWHGEHQLKAGFQYAKREETFGDFGTANGQFNFDTDRPFNASDLTTYPTFFTVRVKGGLDAPIPDDKTLGVFLQDSWRLNGRLTLDLGLRYDKEDITDDNNNYAPRLGFAWDPSGRGKTVVRGGWGRFYDRFQYGFYQDFFQDAVTITQGFLVRFPDAGINQQLFFNLAQANGITSLTALRDFLVLQIESGAGTLLNTAPTVDNPNRKQAYVDSASLGAEHELLPGLSVAVDVVHNENKDTLLLVDLNPFSQSRGGRPNLSIVNGQRVTLGSITSYVNAGKSKYDSLQLSLKKRFTGVYGGRLSYTYSKSSGNYGNAGAGTATAYFQTRTESGYNFDTGQWIGDPLDLNLDDPRNDGQPVNWLRKNTLVLSGSYQVPHTGFHSARGLLVSGIFTYLSGDRTTILTNNRLDNGNRDLAPSGTYNASPPSDIGLTGVSFDGRFFGVEQPDVKRLDLALRYELPLVSGISVGLTGEIYNATSEENFLSVGNNIFGTAGFLTPAATYNPGGRQFQLGVRVGF
ncbi:MAG TPA: TonB-dependent receptor [Thermoanaerobaculia bacterium]|jgi:outer membrane receptor protein involved in Fe transport|nr:TonB-dependent receptor [Thermoanaerobaculia bacterium]